MYTHLKERKYYEERYDDSTVAQCRSGEDIVNGAFKELEKKVPKKELKDKLPVGIWNTASYIFGLLNLLLPNE